ncbi:MAG: trypsin-like peptidase domain-containing protein [Pirellulaceae bacterium]|jgi:S1-C subfamily serine protease|nr:trypsin-like peptidase domain-containing protein [Pirellulaceae bacterium]
MKHFPSVFALAALLVAGVCTAADPIARPEPPESLTKIYEGEPPKSLEQLKAMDAHQRALVKFVATRTVAVQVGEAHGSGVIVSEDGFVLTAAHVAQQPGLTATLLLNDGRVLTGRTLGMNRAVDSGMIKIDKGEFADGELPFAELGESAKLKRGQWCLVAGHPGGYQADRKLVYRLGRLLRISEHVFVSDCPLIGGDSGGPVFDMKGNVIGINSRIGDALNANLHVPVNAYLVNWDEMAKGKAWGQLPGPKPSIGVIGYPDSENAEIVGVGKDSPAEKAGVKEGDVVLEFGGDEIENFAALVEAVNSRRPGQRVTVVVQRGDEKIRLRLVIGHK